MREKRKYKLYEVNVDNIDSLRCEYGNSETFLDVTNIVKSLIETNQIKILRSYNSIFTDPIYGSVKKLRIFYDDSMDEINENEYVVINIK